MAVDRVDRSPNPVPWYAASHRTRNTMLQLAAAGFVGALLGVTAILIQEMPASLAQYAPFIGLALVFPFVAMITGNVRKLLLAAVIFDISFPVNFHLDYHVQEAAFGALGGLEISLTTLALPVLYGLWIAERVAKTPSQDGPRTRLGPGVALILYVAFAALSIVAARNTSLSFFEVALLVQTLLLFIYMVGTIKTREDVVFVMAMFLLSLALESVVMILAPFGLHIHVGSISSRVDTLSGQVVGSLFRTAGTVGSPILAASFVALLIAPALAMLWTPVSRSLKLIAAAGLVLGSLALILTFSRGGWIAAGVSMFVFSFLAWRRGWLSPVIPIGITTMAVLLGIVFAATVAARVNDQESAYSRIPLIEIATRVIADHPLLGVGSNNIVVAEPDYQTPDLAGAWIYAIHDKYLLVWSETGIGALISFVAFLLSTLWWGWKSWRLKDRLLSPIGLSLALAIAGQMIHMFVDVFNSRPQVQELWMAAALITAIVNMGRT